MTEPYQPVSCQRHSELELIIMHKQSIQVQLKTESNFRTELVMPYDMISRSGSGEFLLAHNQRQQKIEIRLDQIIDFEIIPNQ